MTASQADAGTYPAQADAGKPGPVPSRGAHWRAEAMLALEVAGLTGFVFARPTFAPFGRSPETFLARGSDWYDVVLFAAAVVVLPLALIAGVAALTRAFGGRVRRAAHLAVVGGLGWLAAWGLLQHFTDWAPRLRLAVATLSAALLAMARWRAELVGRFLRYAGVGSVLFLAQFLFLSPTASIVLGGRHGGADEAGRAAVAAAVGGDAPPVVVVVLDGLSTGLLLDGDGRIDAGLYPNLAELAAGATWYRNNTTVAPITLQAVPAIWSSRLGGTSTPPVYSQYRHNLFTLLGGTYDLHVGEQVTGLCPLSLCPLERDGSPVPRLLGDARALWEDTLFRREGDPEVVPQAFDARYELFGEWIEEQDFGLGERPDLFAYHLLLPHAGWDYLPDGRRYAAAGRPTGLFVGHWGVVGADVARQRHILQAQAADGLLGRLFDRLRDAGTYDDALIVVTADHGYAFETDNPWRGVSSGNADEIMWVPLLVKAPGQARGDIDDRNTMTIDVLPTIADELGIDLPWDVDGVPAHSAQRDLSDKWIVDWEWHRLHPDDDDVHVRVDGREMFDRVLDSDPVGADSSDPLAVWERTAHGGLVGRRVDELSVGEPAPEAVEVDNLAAWSAVDLRWPPLELYGAGWLPPAPVAVAVNGVVSAVVPAISTPFGISVVHALLWPGALREGENDIALYRIHGPPTDPTLAPVTVEPRD